MGKAWRLHVEHVLGTTDEENLTLIDDSVRLLKAEGREVIFDLEHFFDGWKAHPEYSRRLVETVRDAGADWLVPCDTNGGTLVDEVTEAYRFLRDMPGLSGRLGVHFHNDLGLGVANSLAGIIAGAARSKEPSTVGARGAGTQTSVPSLPA